MKRATAKPQTPPSLTSAVLWGITLAIGFAVIVYASSITADFVYGNV